MLLCNYLLCQAKQALSKPILKALSRPTRAQTGPRLEFHSPSSSTNREARSRSPSPRPSRRHTELSPLDEDLFTDPQIPDGGGGRGAGGGAKKLGRGGKFKEEDLFSDPVFSSSGKDTLDSGKGGTKKPSRIGRFKIIGDSKKSTSLDRGEEMRYNPRVSLKICSVLIHALYSVARYIDLSMDRLGIVIHTCTCTCIYTCKLHVHVRVCIIMQVIFTYSVHLLHTD